MKDNLTAFLIFGAICGFLSFMLLSFYYVFDLLAEHKKKKEEAKERLYDDISKRVKKEIIQYYDSTRNKD